jgi:hypothetical protein
MTKSPSWYSQCFAAGGGKKEGAKKSNLFHGATLPSCDRIRKRERENKYLIQ